MAWAWLAAGSTILVNVPAYLWGNHLVHKGQAVTASPVTTVLFIAFSICSALLYAGTAWLALNRIDFFRSGLRPSQEDGKYVVVLPDWRIDMRSSWHVCSLLLSAVLASSAITGAIINMPTSAHEFGAAMAVLLQAAHCSGLLLKILLLALLITASSRVPVDWPAAFRIAAALIAFILLGLMIGAIDRPAAVLFLGFLDNFTADPLEANYGAKYFIFTQIMEIVLQLAILGLIVLGLNIAQRSQKREDVTAQLSA